MVEVASALAIVLGSLVLLRVAVQLLGIGSPARGGRALRVRESCALGTKKRLHVVEVDGERLLVGVSESGIALLKELPALAEPEHAEEGEPGHAAEKAPLLGLRPRLEGWLRVGARLIPLVLIGLGLDPLAASAETPSLTISLDGAEGPEGLASTLEVLAAVTIVSMAPSILLMATCFTRVVIVLSLLRQAVGIQHAPPNQVLIGLALFVTLFVMAPLGEKIRVEAYEPYVAEEIEAREALDRALSPVRLFLMEHTREADLDLFLQIAESEVVEDLADVPITALLPAFMISELRTAFEIGFMIFLPFLVVDLVIASMLISMGMIVLPPIVISLPFKLMLFVLLDGWNLVLGSLVGGLR